MTATRPQTLLRALVGLLSLGVLLTPGARHQCRRRQDEGSQDPGRDGTQRVLPGEEPPVGQGPADQQPPALRHRHRRTLRRQRLRLPPRHRQHPQRPEHRHLRPGPCQRHQRPDHDLRLPEPALDPGRPGDPVRAGARPGRAGSPHSSSCRLYFSATYGGRYAQPERLAQQVRRQAPADGQPVRHPRVPDRVLQRPRRQPHGAEPQVRQRQRPHQPRHGHAQRAPHRRGGHPGVPGVAVRLLDLARQRQRLGRLLLGPRGQAARHRERHHLAQVDDGVRLRRAPSTSPTSTATPATSPWCCCGKRPAVAPCTS